MNKKDLERKLIGAFKNSGILKSFDIEYFDDDISSGYSPDAYIPQKGVLIEHTRLIDRHELEDTAKWAATVKKINEHLETLLKYKEVSGTYLITLPKDFRVKTENEFYRECAIHILDAVLSNEKQISLSGATLEIEKVSKNDSLIAFTSDFKGGTVDTVETIYTNIEKKLSTANKQLGYSTGTRKIHKRILLISNEYSMVHWDWDLYKAFSRAYSDLIRTYNNIDEIWFQYNLGDENYEHKLIYSREFFLNFEKSIFPSINSDEMTLFSRWFLPLSEMGEEKKEKLLVALKIFLEKNKPEIIFPDEQTRIEMVRFGKWLVEKGNFEDTTWLINKFMDDPDPLDPPIKKLDRRGYDLNAQVKRKNTQRQSYSIVTVKGHLAWTVQSLAAQPQGIVKAFEYTEKFLKKTNHLYLVMQWLYPLIEISSKRMILKNESDESYTRFKLLCFELLNKYSKYPPIAKLLVHVFYYFREVTTKEALSILNKLKTVDDIEALLLYFSFFRERHFTESKYDDEIRNFDSSQILEMTISIIKDQTGKYKDVQSGMAWNIWKILSEDKEHKEFQTFIPIINEYICLEYDPHLFHNFERIIAENFDIYPQQCMLWYKNILNSLIFSLKNKNVDGRSIWISESDEIIEKIAKYYANKLTQFVSKLYVAWIKGAYIGSPKRILSSYKLIEDNKLREKTKVKFQSLYKQMKKMNPRMEDVIFDD